MKMLTLVLFCGLAIFAKAVSLNAQEPKVQTYKLPTFIDCGSSEAVDKIVTKHGEIPFAEMQGAITIPPGDRMIQGKTIMYINPETGGYSLVLELPRNYSGENTNILGIEKCIIGFGDDFKPARLTNKTSI
tara:strand:+ start:982 stop:1374 length:393 start_codon:yes stop_codon:yes gene_type:complete